MMVGEGGKILGLVLFSIENVLLPISYSHDFCLMSSDYIGKEGYMHQSE